MTTAPPTATVRAHPSRVSAPEAEAGRVRFGARAWPWIVLAAGATAGVLSPPLTEAAAPWPFVIALLAFGMPHGAADWAVAARLSGRTGLGARLRGFGGYLAMMAGSLALIAWQPGLSGLLFLLLTVFHFGMADATAVHADRDGRVARWGLVTGRGLLLLATAFATHPEAAWAPFARIGNALSPWAADAWQPDLALLQRLASVGVAAGAALALTSAVARLRAGHGRDAALDLAEAALVVALAACADPLFAVGCYFFGVHAFRHSRRLACTQLMMGGARRGLAQRLVRVHELSLPLMWLTALCLVPLCLMLGGFGPRAIAEASIAFYMITTLPHHLLGLRLPQPDMPPAALAS